VSTQLEHAYVPLPQQDAFHGSGAKIRAYGGAMGGGKSRAICEEAFYLALEHPGLVALICRQSHVSIIPTTKKTMLDEVLRPELILDEKKSGGEDWIRIRTTPPSTFHFIGLDDPGRWFSSEIGLIVIDQAEECDEDTVVKLMTRLRQRNAPNKLILSFNPENPGHWIERWCFEGGAQTEWGFRKDEVRPSGAIRSIGTSEFFFASPRHNPYLPAGYIETLEGMPGHLRKRYLEGLWVAGEKNFFDADALDWYGQVVQRSKPRVIGETTGDPTGKNRADKSRVKHGTTGPLSVWAAPVRERSHPETGRTLPAHRYVVAVDVSSGGSTDYSAIQVVSVEEFEQVAEWQGMADPDLVAVEAARLGWIYNRALIAPEITGGWGYSVMKALQRIRYPNLYTRKIEDRLTRKWTDALGWDTSTKTRMAILDELERVLREREFKLNGMRTLRELHAFIRTQQKDAAGNMRAGKPAAGPGANDDLVMSLAIAVYIALQQPKQLRLERPKPYLPRVSAVTGY
jgi:hypothetical protein